MYFSSVFHCGSYVIQVKNRDANIAAFVEPENLYDAQVSKYGKLFFLGNVLWVYVGT